MESESLWLAVLAGLVVVMAIALIWMIRSLYGRSGRDRPMRNLKTLVERRSRMLSPSEKKFFDSLIAALGDDFYVFPKVACLDLVEMRESIGLLSRARLRKLLSQQHFDFVLCKSRDLSIFGIVELEDFTKTIPIEQRQQRETLINLLSKAVNLRTFYFDVRQDYGGVDIRRLVTGEAFRLVENSDHARHSRSQFTIENSSYSAFAKQRSCPQCNGEVVTKIAVKGKRIGEKYLMCRKYPYCDYKMPLRDRDLVAKIRREASVDADKSAHPKFSNWAK